MFTLKSTSPTFRLPQSRDGRFCLFTNIKRILMMGFLLLPHLLVADEVKVDHSAFDVLLKKYVVDDRVDYQKFLADKNALELYLKQLDTIDYKKLNNNEQLALFINAYNAYTISLILDNYSDKLKSIKDLKSPWDTKFCRIGGEKFSLNDIENKFLREQLKEPRIHFAINCASISCPPLQKFAFQGDLIESQLMEVTKKFINSPFGVKINGQNLELSQIFNWFKKDFEKNGISLVSFIYQYFNLETQKTLPDISKITISYQEYQWNLNDVNKERK